MQKVIRYIIIALIIIVLVIISVGIVKFVPKAMNGLANATVSFGSIFDNNESVKPTTAQPSTTTPPTKSSTNQPTKEDDFKISDVIPANQKSQTSNTSRTTNQYYNSSVGAGVPDLVVTILEQGITNRVSGFYSASNSFTTGDVVTVKFRVDNRGNGATGPWSLRVNMPSSLQSDTQKTFTSLTSLPAGSAITGQAVFDQPLAGTQQISIMADYLGLISESNETNNTAVINIQVVQGNSYNQYNPYNPYYQNNNYQNNNYGNTNLSCPSGYYLSYVNNQYQCYPNGNNYYPNNNGGVSGTGGADLQVRVLEIGTIDPYTNQFYSNGTLACNQTYPNTDCSSGAYIRYGQRIAVRFQIYNSGGQPSGQFYYRTDLGSTASQNRTSGPEASLQPGATNTYTVGFDTVTVGQNTVTLYADSQSSVSETNESNNVMRVNFTVSPYVQY